MLFTWLRDRLAFLKGLQELSVGGEFDSAAVVATTKFAPTRSA